MSFSPRAQSASTINAQVEASMPSSSSLAVIEVDFLDPIAVVGISLIGKDVRATVRAVVTPSRLSGEVAFDSSNTSRAIVEEIARSIGDNGATTVTLRVTGITASPAPWSDSDARLLAVYRANGDELNSIPIKVIIPVTCIHEITSDVSITNSVVFQSPHEDQIHLGTDMRRDIRLTFFDQFNEILDCIYDGAGVVSETWSDKTIAGTGIIGMYEGEMPQTLSYGVLLDPSGTEASVDDLIATDPFNTWDSENVTRWEHFQEFILGHNTVHGYLSTSVLWTPCEIYATQHLTCHGHIVLPNYRRHVKALTSNYDPDDPNTFPQLNEEQPV